MPEENGAHKEPYVSKSFSSSFFDTPKKREVLEIVKNLKPKDDKGFVEVADEDIIEEVQHQTREKVLPPHLTYGVPDNKFRNPLNENLKLPERMHAYAGNESGSIEANFAHGEVYATTDIGYG